MAKEKIRNIRDSLKAQQTAYGHLAQNLQDEKHLAQAEATAARQSLEPVLAGFVSRLVPDMDAPALATFDSLIAAQNHPRRPERVRQDLERQNARAFARLTELASTHGSLEDLQRTRQVKDISAETLEAIVKSAAREAQSADGVLRAFDKINTQLESKGHPALTAETLGHYQRPDGRLARFGRWLTDGAYRTARPVLDGYEERGIDLTTALNGRREVRASLDGFRLEQQQLDTERTLTQQRITAQEEQMALQRSPREILSEVRTVITDALLDRATFLAARNAFPADMPAEAEGLSLRADLFSKLADNILKQHREASEVKEQLADPLSKLDKAVRNGKGSKAIEFDLAGKTAGMQRHQTLLNQRLHASRDIRTAADQSGAIASASHSSDSNNFLLWYLILNNNSPSHAAAPAFQGTREGTGSLWHDQPAENSYFRAEMLGVTPDNAKGIGLDSSQLRIAPETLSDLGVSGSDIRGIDFGGAAGTDSGLSGLDTTGSSVFNGVSSGIDLDTRKLDLGSLASDISTDIGSSIGSLSTDIGSGSIDFGSSSGSFDCGGGGGGGCGGFD